MEEKILIKSEQYYAKKLFMVMVVIGIILSLTLLVTALTTIEYPLLVFFSEPTNIIAIALPFIIMTLVGRLINNWLRSYNLTVTNKRIYGMVAWGKRVDLPADSVSAVATSPMKGIVIATSSGRINFKLIKNRNEIHAAISSLLIERQNKLTSTTIKQEIPQSNADELKKYKELLDSGVITQEEFEAKKNQLLGL